MTRGKWVRAGIVAIVLAAPLVAAAEPADRDPLDILGAKVVTGHTIYAFSRHSFQQFDPNIGAAAGLMERKVVWFNGAMIFNSTAKGFVYATESNTCDPREGTDFIFLDQNLTYFDPNGLGHVVTHYNFRCGETDEKEMLAQLAPPSVGDSLRNGSVPSNASADPGEADDDHLLLVNITGTALREDVWVTPLHPKQIQFFPPTTFKEYNFALAVDFRFFNNAPIQVRLNKPQAPEADVGPVGFSTEGGPFADRHHDGRGGQTPAEIEDGDSQFGPCPDDPSRTCHTPDAPQSNYNRPHNHTAAEIHLYLNKKDLGGSSRDCTADDDGEPWGTYCERLYDKCDGQPENFDEAEEGGGCTVPYIPDQP